MYIYINIELIVMTVQIEQATVSQKFISKDLSGRTTFLSVRYGFIS